MNLEKLRKFIEFNRAFSQKGLKKNYLVKSAKILVDLQITDLFMVCSIMKIASVFSDALMSELIVVPSIKANKHIIKLIKSYGPKTVVNPYKILFLGFLSNFFKIFNVLLKVNTGEDLVALKIDGAAVGMHIYDTIIARFRLGTIKRLTLIQKFHLFLELSFFYYMVNFVNKENIFCTILPDNVYREGLLFEISKAQELLCIAGIDINGISMHKYKTREDFREHCRTPDFDLVDEVMKSSGLYSRAEEYLDYRISGKEQQHDAIRAYSAEKKDVSRFDLVAICKGDLGKKNVLIMAHIFCDAPHAYPEMLFKDYQDWLLQTCLRLSRNPNINLLVKEHPSVKLYGEEGMVGVLLEGLGLADRLVPSDINTRSLFSCVDVVVTCGGTAGMEFPCYGIPVLVAAKPPYTRFSFVKSPCTIEEYYSELEKIHENERIPENGVQLARSVLYVIQSLMRINRNCIGLGSQPYLRGGDFDLDLFMDEMIHDCVDGEGYYNLTREVRGLLTGKYKNLVDYKKTISSQY